VLLILPIIVAAAGCPHSLPVPAAGLVVAAWPPIPPRRRHGPSSTQLLMSRVAEAPTVEPATKAEGKSALNNLSPTIGCCRPSMEHRIAPADHTDHGAVSVTEDTTAAESKPTVSNAPLGPPPRPTTTGDTPDYFNT
jgi:hypothetical protein